MLSAIVGSKQQDSSQIYHFLLIEDEQNKRLIPLEASTYSIGRDAENSIVLKSKWVSRQHAILLRVTSPNTSNYVFRIIDGDLQGKRSTNGLSVNGQRCASQELKHGDIILFGKEAKAKYYQVDNFTSAEYLKEIRAEDVSDILSKSASFQRDDRHDSTSIEGEQAGGSETALVRLASFPELVPNPIVEIDISGKITYLNPAAIKQFPTLQEEKIHHPLLRDLLSRIQSGNQKHFIREVGINNQVFEQCVHYLHESDLIRSYIIDITEHKQTEAALRKSEAKNSALLNAIPDLMFQLNSKGDILNLKLTDEYPLQLTPQDCLHRNICDVLPATAAHQAIYHLKRAMETLDAQVFEYEVIQEQTVLYYEARIVVSTENEFLVIVRDVSERKSFEQQLIHDALHDALTGLPNRTLFINRLEHVIGLNKRRLDFRFAVLFVDLDRFKVINDSLGHVTGDQLLVAISRQLETCLREGDTVARLGGDEFAILLEDITSVDDATRIAERVQKELANPFKLDNHEVFTTASIGIALSDTGYDRPEELLRDADIAMYHAKALGKARYELFDRTMHARVVALLQLDNDLRRAVEREEFQIYYQPIVSLQTGKITGFEALARWQHPTRGVVSPDEFIHLAEETGLIFPISEWVMHQACQQLRRWQEAFPSQAPRSMSVNLSGKQFTQRDLAQQIEHILRQTGVSPDLLNLEITESAIMDNSKLSHNTLAELKALGIKLSIDDFGTGYSSLSYLHRFPFDLLKADRSFIGNLDNSHENTGLEITRTIMMLAHNLGISVVAEGIETPEQLALLRELNCNYGQGFLFARPLNQEAAEALLTSDLSW